jgi:hypothetical protein
MLFWVFIGFVVVVSVLGGAALWHSGGLDDDF